MTWNNLACLLFIFKHASPIHVYTQAQICLNKISLVFKTTRRATQPFMELQPTNPSGAQALQLATATAPMPTAEPRVQTWAQPSSHQATSFRTSLGTHSCKEGWLLLLHTFILISSLSAGWPMPTDYNHG